MELRKAQEILEELLVGQSYAAVTLGDWWRFRFSNGLWLLAQEVTSPRDKELCSLLERLDPPVLDGVDPEYVPQGIVIFRNLKTPVTRISLEDNGTLGIHFGENWSMCLATDTKIVDWQWCVNGTGQDPYTDLIVGCYFSGEVTVDEEAVGNVGSKFQSIISGKE